MMLAVPFTINFFVFLVYYLLNHYSTTTPTETRISQDDVISYFQYCIFIINGAFFCILLADCWKNEKIAICKRNECLSSYKQCKKPIISIIFRVLFSVIFLVIIGVLYFCIFIKCANILTLFKWSTILSPIICFLYYVLINKIAHQCNICNLTKTVTEIKNTFAELAKCA